MSCLGRQTAPFNVLASRTVSVSQPPAALEAIAAYSINPEIPHSSIPTEWGSPSLQAVEFSVLFILNVAWRSVRLLLWASSESTSPTDRCILLESYQSHIQKWPFGRLGKETPLEDLDRCVTLDDELDNLEANFPGRTTSYLQPAMLCLLWA